MRALAAVILHRGKRRGWSRRQVVSVASAIAMGQVPIASTICVGGVGRWRVSSGAGRYAGETISLVVHGIICSHASWLRIIHGRST